MSTILIYKNFLELFLKSFNLIFLVFVILMILESFVAILTVLSIAPFADYMIDNNLSNPSKITDFTLQFFNTLNLEPNLILFAFIFVITNILRSVFEVSIKYGSMKIKYFLMEIINLDLINSLMNSKWSYINTLSHGKLLNSIVREVGAVGDCMGTMATQIATVFKLIVLCAIPIYLYPKFMMTVFMFCLIFLLPFLIFQKVIYRLGKKTTSTANQTVSHLSEIIRNLRLIKGFVRNDYMSERYKKSIRDHFDVALKSHTLTYAFSSFYQPLGIIAIVTTAIIYENILISDFAVIIWSLLQSLPLIGRLLNANAIIINSYPSLEQVFEIKHQAIENKEIKNDIYINQIKDIKLKKVSFLYNDTVVLDEINMTFKNRKITAIFGESGSGKSTIVDLIMVFQDPSKGTIMINNELLSDINLNSVRNKLGFVPQDNAFIKGTIRENISFGKLNAKEIEIDEAIEFSDATKIFENRPGGKDNFISDNGTNFSGGQKQKLALARSYVRNPDFYLLDETTSSLDLTSERKIIRNFNKLKKNFGVLLITHNIKTLTNIDYIYFVENGKVSGEGSFKNLKSSNQNFKKLCDAEGI